MDEPLTSLKHEWWCNSLSIAGNSLIGFSCNCGFAVALAGKDHKE